MAPVICSLNAVAQLVAVSQLATRRIISGAPPSTTTIRFSLLSEKSFATKDEMGGSPLFVTKKPVYVPPVITAPAS